MKQIQATVMSNAEVASGIRLLQLWAPEVAASAEPGQFVHVRCSKSLDPLLRRPFSLHRIGRSAVSEMPKRGISLLFQVVGRGTSQLADLEPDDSVDVLGPLGRGFTLRASTRRLLLVAGGLGIAPLVAAADAAIERDVAVTALAGARTANRLLPARFLPPEVEYVVATEDGSAGRRGLVTDLVGNYLDWADQVLVCGPGPMLPAIAAVTSQSSALVQVSLEERMACGLGACLGCVVETRSGPQRVCRDGPVFALGELKL